MKNLKVAIGKDFSFTCESSSLINAMSKVRDVTTKLSSSTEFEKKYVVFAYQKGVYVVGYSSDTFIVTSVQDADVKGAGSFGFDPVILSGVIKNRKEMNFSFSKGRLSFSAVKGRYNGNIETFDVGEDQVPFMEKNMRERPEEKKPLAADTLSVIREGIKIVDLKDHYTKDKITCGIRIRKGVLDICAYDNFHMSYYKTQVDSRNNFTLAMPVETFKLIDKFISEEKDDSSRFYMNNKELKITSGSFIIVLPPVQVDENYFDAVPGYIRSLKEPVAEIPFTQSAIKTADNMFTLATDETRLSMTVLDSGRVDLSLITEQGKISDAFKFSDLKSKVKKFNAFIDPRIFDDLFKKVSDRKIVKVRFFKKKNAGVSSSFMISASSENVKAYLIGTYHEEKE